MCNFLCTVVCVCNTGCFLIALKTKITAGCWKSSRSTSEAEFIIILLSDGRIMVIIKRPRAIFSRKLSHSFTNTQIMWNRPNYCWILLSTQMLISTSLLSTHHDDVTDICTTHWKSKSDPVRRIITDLILEANSECSIIISSHMTEYS